MLERKEREIKTDIYVRTKFTFIDEMSVLISRNVFVRRGDPYAE